MRKSWIKQPYYLVGLIQRLCFKYCLQYSGTIKFIFAKKFCNNSSMCFFCVKDFTYANTGFCLLDYY